MQKPSILRACVREEDAGGRDAGAPWDLKMPLENGRADERVSRGQASERAVCVCEAVSVEMGARRPPLPTAVVCPPGRRRRLRLAITAVLEKATLATAPDADILREIILSANATRASRKSYFSDKGKVALARTYQ